LSSDTLAAKIDLQLLHDGQRWKLLNAVHEDDAANTGRNRLIASGRASASAESSPIGHFTDNDAPAPTAGLEVYAGIFANF
jgi:hypothetical protein